MCPRSWHSLDSADVELSRPYTTSSSGKSILIAVRLGLHNHAPRTSATIQTRITPRLRRIGCVETASGGVQRHLVVRVQIDTLDNVDFAVVWPKRAFGPERRPDGTAVRDVQQVDDPHAAVIIEVLRRDTNLSCF